MITAGPFFEALDRWEDTENHMVLPAPEPDDPVPDFDEDEAYEKERQRQIDEAVENHRKEITDQTLRDLVELTRIARQIY